MQQHVALRTDTSISGTEAPHSFEMSALAYQTTYSHILQSYCNLHPLKPSNLTTAMNNQSASYSVYLSLQDLVNGRHWT